MPKAISVAAATALLSIITQGASASISTQATTFPIEPTWPVITQLLEPEPLLVQAAPMLSLAVAERAQAAMECAQEDGLQVDKLIVVDMGLPAMRKRLWAFDLTDGSARLILNTWVAHGSGSDLNGDGRAERFSNLPNSNMTSLGLYRVAEGYQGKNGWSRRLDGLFARFNSNARERAVVMHPSSYVGPGHVGRSQGCPAVNPATMEALEQAGLTNAVLWIDGPDQALAEEVQACAQRREQRLMAMAATRLMGSLSQVFDVDPVLPWASPWLPVVADARLCRPMPIPGAAMHACEPTSELFG